MAPATPIHDPLAVLEVGPSATDEQIEASYRGLQSQPSNRSNGLVSAIDTTQPINVAWDILSDSDEEREYETQHHPYIGASAGNTTTSQPSWQAPLLSPPSQDDACAQAEEAKKKAERLDEVLAEILRQMKIAGEHAARQGTVGEHQEEAARQDTVREYQEVAAAKKAEKAEAKKASKAARKASKAARKAKKLEEVREAEMRNHIYEDNGHIVDDELSMWARQVIYTQPSYHQAYQATPHLYTSDWPVGSAGLPVYLQAPETTEEYVARQFKEQEEATAKKAKIKGKKRAKKATYRVARMTAKAYKKAKKARKKGAIGKANQWKRRAEAYKEVLLCNHQVWWLAAPHHGRCIHCPRRQKRPSFYKCPKCSTRACKECFKKLRPQLPRTTSENDCSYDN